MWCGDDRCEVRDGSSSVTAQFFTSGETISGSSYYFTRDHLSSIREMTNSAGTIVWQQSFDPYGRLTTIVSTTAADMGYAGYYVQGRSALNLTRTRAYSASFGRFMSRDPIGEAGGTNLYDYVENNPVSLTDPSGTDCKDPNAPPCITNYKDCVKWCSDNSKCIPGQWERATWFAACVKSCRTKFPPPKPKPVPSWPPGSWPGPGGNGFVPIPIPGTPWSWPGVNTPWGPVPLIPIWIPGSPVPLPVPL